MDHGDGYIAVVGLGYIGLPLAAALADAGRQVFGLDTDPAAQEAARRGEPAFAEPGVGPLLRSLRPGALTVGSRLPDTAPAAVIICVGTPADPVTRRPDLRDLEAAVASVTPGLGDDTLVVLRSTVPIGTCRTVVEPLLRRQVAQPLLAFCPERTIQGRALDELRTLPQIVGGLDERSTRRAVELLKLVAPDQVVVSGLEAAEAVKLICNAHTDMLYGFGNEVALIAERFGLDAYELIESANLHYPRPDLARPGYVGGSCLVKDPYLLIDVSTRAGYVPAIVSAARAVNESLPGRATDRVLTALAGRGPLVEQKVLVAGIAYKGHPETDDVRGAASVEVARRLAGRVGVLAGHDFVVPDERVARLGLEPTGLDDGLRGADALLLLTDHAGYRDLTAECLLGLMHERPVVYDVWSVLHERLSGRDDLTYLGLGRG
jgi:UDP-N-acetyl-D-mannosaminuronic acid dehydrogenase